MALFGFYNFVEVETADGVLVVDKTHNQKVKRIQDQPVASISLQKHHGLAEPWLIFKGKVQISNGDIMFLLADKQSTYIPLVEVHRLANSVRFLLKFINVQSGSYLGVCDLFRFEDNYWHSAK